MFSGVIPNMKYEYELILCRPNKEEIGFIEYSDLTFNPVFLGINKLNVTINREYEGALSGFTVSEKKPFSVYSLLPPGAINHELWIVRWSRMFLGLEFIGGVIVDELSDRWRINPSYVWEYRAINGEWRFAYLNDWSNETIYKNFADPYDGIVCASDYNHENLKSVIDVFSKEPSSAVLPPELQDLLPDLPADDWVMFGNTITNIYWLECGVIYREQENYWDTDYYMSQLSHT
jgi:hypothetical protein